MRLSNQELNIIYDSLTREKLKIRKEALKAPMTFQSFNNAVKTVIGLQAKIHQEQLTRAMT